MIVYDGICIYKHLITIYILCTLKTKILVMSTIAEREHFL